MVKNQKPAPDIFLEAARRIGVEPKFCRAYEDTDLGLQAIRAAGMDAVDVRELIARRLKIDSTCGLRKSVENYSAVEFETGGSPGFQSSRNSCK